MTTRIKDFSILELSPSSDVTASDNLKPRTILTTACSDGMIRIWELSLPSNPTDDDVTTITKQIESSITESPNKKIKGANPTNQQKDKVNGHTKNDNDKDVDMQIQLADKTQEQPPQQVEETAPDMSIGTLVGFVETGRRITCMTTVNVQDVVGGENDNEDEKVDGEEVEASESDDSEDE